MLTYALVLAAREQGVALVGNIAEGAGGEGGDGWGGARVVCLESKCIHIHICICIYL